MTTMLLSQHKPCEINKQENKFESMLFLPVCQERNGEGGLRKKGYFKYSYKYIAGDTFSLNSKSLLDINVEYPASIGDKACSNNGKWCICDTEGNILKQVSIETQEKIRRYIKGLSTENQRITYIPLITIVTSVLNRAKTLEETIQSITRQTYPNIEYIIIDGGSTDGTLDIIKKYEDSIDYWVSEQDKGIYDAWNKAIKVFLGDYVGFLGSGDTFFYDSIKSYVDYILMNSRVDYISSKVELYNKRPIRIVGSKWEWNKFKKFMNVAHVGSLHSRNLFSVYGLFNATFRTAGDYEFLMRAGNNLAAGFIDKVTTRMDINKYSVSSNNYAVFETVKIKITHTQRSKLTIYFEASISILKSFLRKIIGDI